MSVKAAGKSLLSEMLGSLLTIRGLKSHSSRSQGSYAHNINDLVRSSES